MHCAGTSTGLIFPDPEGNTKTTFYVFCNSDPAALPTTLFGSSPQPSEASIPAWAGVESGLDVLYSPVEKLAEKFGIEVSGDECVLFKILMPWSLESGEVTVRVPPMGALSVVGAPPVDTAPEPSYPEPSPAPAPSPGATYCRPSSMVR